MTTTLADVAQRVTSVPAAGPAVPLFSGTLTGAFQGNLSAVLPVSEAREATLLVRHDPHASQSGGIVNLLVAFAFTEAAPAMGSEDWYIPTRQNPGSVGALPGTIPTGAKFAAASGFEPQEARRLYYHTEAVSASQPIRDAIVVPCAGARWMYVAATQSGDTTNFGAVAVSCALHA